MIRLLLALVIVGISAYAYLNMTKSPSGESIKDPQKFIQDFEQTAEQAIQQREEARARVLEDLRRQQQELKNAQNSAPQK